MGCFALHQETEWKYCSDANYLFPDREEKTLTTWLKPRKTIRVISRDRYSNYQKASTLGAPSAIQLTDRWHLLKNLGEALKKVLYRENVVMKKVREDNSETKSFPARMVDKTGISPALKKFIEIKQILAEGLAIKEIARRLKMTVIR
jgi:DNA-binding NarL/FixJ family response regulator